MMKVAGWRKPCGRRRTATWDASGMVARELLVLAVRELVVLILVVGFVVWLAYRLLRESRR
jgi:hypothetical protein